MRLPRPSALLILGALTVLAEAAACRRGLRAEHDEGDHPGAPGMLRRIAMRLEDAYGAAALPAAREEDRLADRLAKWKGFRDCAARTYAARRSAAARGVPLPQGAAGLAAVEECAVQGAVAEKDEALCDRLERELAAPGGRPGLGGIRCHDTRARVLGLPDECPVVDLPGGRRGRNPECLAAAHRDPSVCTFADEPTRCRAIVHGDEKACSGSPSANCRVAVTYWSRLIPAAQAAPLVRGDGASAVFDVRGRRRTSRLTAPAWALSVSWPFSPTSGRRVELGWGGGIALAFGTEGQLAGVRPVQPGGAGGAAGVTLAFDDGGDRQTCAPDAGTAGRVRFDAGRGQPGAWLAGTLDARNMPCTDGDVVDVSGTFRVAILDTR